MAELSQSTTDDLTGSVAVVLGAGGGLGAGFAQRLAARGARLMLSDYESGPLAEVEGALRKDGVEVRSFQADITKSDQVDALAQAAIEGFGAVDIVCNTVGVSSGTGRAWETKDEDWRWVLAVNLGGAINVARTFVPYLLARDRGYLMLTSSTTAVLAPLPNMAVYLTSKHAVVALAEALQRDLETAGSAVRASVAFPGAIRSQMSTGQRNRQPEYGGPVDVDEAEAAAAATYLQTHGTPGEVLAEQMIPRLLAGDFYLFGRPQDVPYVTERAAGIVGGYLAPRPPIGPPRD
jgi:NAD(P)-dependent dehydrogenase (short-subunit alcohol dehydrogenase family)